MSLAPLVFMVVVIGIGFVAIVWDYFHPSEEARHARYNKRRMQKKLQSAVLPANVVRFGDLRRKRNA